MEDYHVPLDRGRYAILRIPERLDPDEAARLTAYIGSLVTGQGQATEAGEPDPVTPKSVFGI
jgi:hypothetical protein